jgi:hypothetical protein
VTDQNPAGPHEPSGQAPSAHEAFGSAPASGSGAGHESSGSAGSPSIARPATPAPPVPTGSSVVAPAAAESASPVVPAQSASPAVESAPPVAPPAMGSASVTAQGSVLGQAPAATPAGPPPAPAKGGAWKWIVTGAVILLVAVAAIAVVVLRNNQANSVINAISVGDCVDSSQYEPELGTIPANPTVSCDDTRATHKVIGIVDGQSAASLDDDSVCTPWPQTTATIWLGEHDKSGKIYCLADLGR